MKARLAFLLFLCSVFLAVASVGLAGENSKLRVCVRRCAFQNDNSYLACHARCKLPAVNRDEEKEEAAEKDPRLPDPHHPREPKRGDEEGSQEEEKPQWQREKEEERRHKKEQEKEEEEQREKEREEEKEKEREKEREEEKERAREKEQEREEEEERAREKEQEREEEIERARERAREKEKEREEAKERAREKEKEREEAEERAREKEKEEEIEKARERAREKEKEREEAEERAREKVKEKEEEIEKARERAREKEKEREEEEERAREKEKEKEEEIEKARERAREKEKEKEEEEERAREKEKEKEEEIEKAREKDKEKEEEKEKAREKVKEKEEEIEKEKEHQENPYYLPSNKFQTRFENEYGRIGVLQKFDELSPHLQMLKYYRIVKYKARPGTLIAPHHSDAEYLIITAKGRALVTILLPNYKESFNLEPFDVLRVPAGAICYTINRANGEDLELYKLAMPVNIPGQLENFYPSGNQIPYSYLKAFEKKTIQAAYKAPYEEIEEVLWGSSEEQGQGSEEGVILKLKREQYKSLISRAQIRLAKGGKESPLGPFNLKSDVQARYSNNHGTFHEAHPHRYEPLSDLAIGVSHLKLNQGSMFMPHYNTRAIILGIVADGEGHAEIASPHLANKEEGEHKEGQVKSLSANVTKGDLYIIPAGHPVSVRASENSILEVVEFVLNAPYNFRNFLAGEKDNVLNEIDREVYDAVFEGSGKQVERLFNRQRESFFVDREEQQPSGGRGVMSPRQMRNRVAWSSLFTMPFV